MGEAVADYIRENNRLKDEMKRLNDELESFRENEKTLKETMITAQKITEDMKNNVRREGELVIAEAKTKADEILKGAHQRVVDLQGEITQLKRQRIQFENELRSSITTHLKILDADSAESSERARLEEKVTYMSGKE